MPRRFESIELRSSHDKYSSHEALPPPYNAPHYAPPPYDAPRPAPRSHGITKSSLFLGLYLVVPALAAASAIVLGFKASVAAEDRADAPPGPWPYTEGVLMAAWPSSLFPNQDGLPLAAAALALGTAVLMGVLLLFAARRGPLTMSFPRRLAIIVQLGLTVAVALVSTIYTFVLNGRSALFDLTYATDAAPSNPGTFTYDRGTFTREYWACAVGQIPGGAVARACILETGSRWMAVFIFFFSAGLFVMVFVDSRGGRHFMRS